VTFIRPDLVDSPVRRPPHTPPLMVKVGLPKGEADSELLTIRIKVLQVKIRSPFVGQPQSQLRSQAVAVREDSMTEP